MPGLCVIFHGMAMSLAGKVQEPTEETARINNELEKIFARPEFQDKPKELWSYLFERIKSFIEWLGTLQDVSPVLYWILVAICLVVLVFLLAHIALTVIRVFSVDRSKRDISGKSLRRQLSAQYQFQAEEAARGKEYTEAIRFLFLSLVYHYDENDQFVFRPALTNREYLSGFADRAALSAQLTGFVDILDEHWYGMQPCSEETYLKYRHSYDQLMRRGGRG